MRKILQFILIMMLAAASCGRSMSVNSALRGAEQVMNEQPDSALRLIRSIDRKRIKGKAALARYALFYSQALDKNYVDITRDSLTRIAVEYYMRRGSKREKALALYYHGRVYENAGDEERSSDLFVQAEVFAHGLKEEEPYLWGLICDRLAIRYYVQSGYEEAMEYFREAEKAYTKAGIYLNAGLACRGQSQVYFKRYDFRKAYECMCRGIEFFEKCGCRSEIDLSRRGARILDVVSDSTKDDRERVVLLREYAAADSSRLTVGEWSWLAHYYGKAEHVDSARYYVKRVTDFTKGDPDYYAWSYFSLAEVEKVAHDYHKALDYLERGKMIQDSLDSVRRVFAVKAMGRRIQTEKLRYDYESLQSRSHYQLIIACLGFLLAAVLGWQSVRSTRRWRQRFLEQQQANVRKRDERVAQLTATYDELKGQYELLAGKVNTAAVPDQQEVRFYEALETRLTGLRNLVENAYTYKAKPTSFFKAFAEYAAVSPSAKKAVWADLQYVVNKKFGGFVDHLQETYPELGPHDLDLCCLICFGFSPTGICFVYGYEDVGSLYNKRSRLRQKLHLSSDEKLEEFLIALCRKSHTASPRGTRKKRDRDDSPAA